MKLIMIHKEAFTDSVPNLKSFMMYAARNNHKIVLLTTRSTKFPEPSFKSGNFRYIAVTERMRFLQLPTLIRFYSLCASVLVGNLFRKYKLILAGQNALALGYLISIMGLKKYCGFIIEYPEFSAKLGGTRGFLEKLACKGIRRAQLLITHDKLHGDLISEHLGMKDLKFFTIPNGTLGEATISKSRFLHERLGIPLHHKVLLHAGGFGPWFESKSLARRSADLPYSYKLVFHVNHDVTDDDYYKEYIKKKSVSDKCIFSMTPVDDEELDRLISSATIGIAWYSRDILGFRATMLGLAAGKIGNYLKCGIPVIVPDYDSLGYISEFSCGKQISELKELNDAIAQIDGNYKEYSQKALLCYNDLWAPEKYCRLLMSELERND